MTNVISLAIWLLFQVESSGNPAPPAGDGGRAVGPFQMWPVAVAEANRLARTERWALADRADFDPAHAMVRIILAHHYKRGDTDPVTLASRWRNPYSECPQWYLDRLENEYERAIRNYPQFYDGIKRSP